MITKEDKREIIKKFGKNEQDSGSSAVQVAILTKRINDLKPHFNAYGHDFCSNRGLMKMIGKRKALLKYMARENPQGYARVLKDLNLRK